MVQTKITPSLHNLIAIEREIYMMFFTVILVFSILLTSSADQSLRGRGLAQNPVCELCRDGSLPRNPATRVVSLFFEGLKVSLKKKDGHQPPLTLCHFLAVL